MEILSCQKRRLVSLLNLLTQYGNLDCFHALSLVTMFSLMHICKCTISVSSYQITVSSVALSPRTHTHNSLISFILLWVSPYWKIRERLVGWPVLYNMQNLADDKAFNFHIVCRLNTSLERLPASCYLTILYICAHIITISKHTKKTRFHHRETLIVSSAAALRGAGNPGKRKRQASGGRRTFRCHCQPQQKAAIESAPLRNSGKWRQRGSSSALFSPTPPHRLLIYIHAKSER